MTEDSSETTVSEDGRTWVVERFTRRVVWTNEKGECDNCDATLELGLNHYYAFLRTRGPSSSDEKSRSVVFCSRSCGEAWLRS